MFAYVSRAVERWQPWVITAFFIFKGNRDIAAYHVERRGKGHGPLEIAISELQDTVALWCASPECHISPIEFFNHNFPDSMMVDHRLHS